MSAKLAMTPEQAAALDRYERLVATVPGMERTGARQAASLRKPKEK